MMIFFLCSLLILIITSTKQSKRKTDPKEEQFPAHCSHDGHDECPLCSVHANYRQDCPYICTNKKRKKKISYSNIAQSHYVMGKKEAYHLYDGIEVVEDTRPDFVDLPPYCCHLCWPDLIEDIKNQESQTLDDELHESIISVGDLDDDDLDYKGELICGKRSLWETLLYEASQGKVDQGIREMLLFNNIFDDRIRINTIGKCPYAEYQLKTEVEEIKCNNGKWKRWYLDDVTKSGSKNVCDRDYIEGFIGRGDAMTLNQYLDQQEASGVSSAYKDTTLKKIFSSSSAFFAFKFRQYSDKMVEWEHSIFGGPLCISDDENWERKCVKKGESHALSSCTLYVSCETGMPLDFIIMNVNMVRNCDKKPKVFVEWRDSSNSILNKEYEDFPIFTSLYSHVYAARRFPDAQNRVFDGCTHGVSFFYNVEVPLHLEQQFETLKGLYPADTDIQMSECTPVEQDFDGYHGHSVKFKRLGKYFKRFENFHSDPVTPSLFNFVFEECDYRTSSLSDCWYPSVFTQCMEEIYSIADFYDRLDEIFVSEEKLRIGIRGSSSTTYLTHEEKNDMFLFCLTNTDYYYFHLNLNTFVDHRRNFKTLVASLQSMK